MFHKMGEGDVNGLYNWSISSIRNIIKKVSVVKVVIVFRSSLSKLLFVYQLILNYRSDSFVLRVYNMQLKRGYDFIRVLLF